MTMTDLMTTQEFEVIKAYSALFIHSDAREWDKVALCFDDHVTVDYASLNGQPAAVLKREDLIEGWSAFLPKFKFTLHYLTNHSVTIKGDHAEACCYGHAMHHLPAAEGGDIWEVFGTYNITLRRIDKKWVVTALRYNHKYASGNLPSL